MSPYTIFQSPANSARTRFVSQRFPIHSVSTRCRTLSMYQALRTPQESLNNNNNNNSINNEGKSTHFGYKTVAEADKEKLVRGVFSSVATSYDRMNDAMSFGVHRLWKDQFVKRIDPGKDALNQTVLDVAGGTGDIAFRLLDWARDVNHDKTMKVIVADINENMLREGARRALGSPNDYIEQGRLKFMHQDAETLDKIADESVDVYTIAFGIRNCTHVDRAIQQAFRVLKPGGLFSCLEFSKLPNPLLNSLYKSYSFSIIPIMGSLIAGDRDSYQYLVESIDKFPDQEAFARMIMDAGFVFEPSLPRGYYNMTCGVVANHRAIKPFLRG